MPKIERRKVALNTTVSPRIGKQIDDLVGTSEFSSQSDIVSVALTEFFVREEQREKEKKMAKLYSVLIQHKEGRDLLDEVPRTPKERVEALTKAGIALVEAGKYEEAKKCFAQVKEFESGQSLEQEKKIDQKGKDEYIGEEIFE